jgi:hypothetical protein
MEISHPDPKAIDRVVQAFKEGRLCDEFIPVPQELKDAVADGKTNEKLVEEYGYSNWYDFCVNEWGTKWDVGDEYSEPYRDTPNDLTFSFDSAWSPPTGLCVQLEAEGYTVRAYYYEPGMGFAGIYEDGYDETYSLEGTSEEVKEEIPERLDEMFNITESMAEWEADNEDEA